jgi:hypothetical protein
MALLQRWTENMNIFTERQSSKVQAPLRSSVATLVLLACAPAASALSPARATMPVPLSEVVALAKPYPNLLLQIRLELVRANTTRDKVTCTAEQLEPVWIKFKNARIGPYRCQIGKRNLAITTTPQFFDERGYKLKPTAADVTIKAARLQESKLKWQWK